MSFPTHPELRRRESLGEYYVGYELGLDQRLGFGAPTAGAVPEIPQVGTMRGMGFSDGLLGRLPAYPRSSHVVA